MLLYGQATHIPLPPELFEDNSTSYQNLRDPDERIASTLLAEPWLHAQPVPATNVGLGPMDGTRTVRFSSLPQCFASAESRRIYICFSISISTLAPSHESAELNTSNPSRLSMAIRSLSNIWTRSNSPIGSNGFPHLERSGSFPPITQIPPQLRILLNNLIILQPNSENNTRYSQNNQSPLDHSNSLLYRPSTDEFPHSLTNITRPRSPTHDSR
ncbi:unnamed protein product [Protopolystoma xenopodis]|uniref:Uncharacterized protein n=1 Tax=Protopolystoma xenopodis TaxID=117903 RepID=A0A448WHQ5_9PLAT|nr:unnamed protein product [Protopolystoma xenopodis]